MQEGGAGPGHGLCGRVLPGTGHDCQGLPGFYPDLTFLAILCHIFSLLQNEAKAKGHPWAMAKMFDTSLPVSTFIPLQSVPDPHNVSLWCKVNGETRQDGNTKDMIFNLPTLISFISQYFTLEEGDMILTGTPSGVGPVKQGDVITGGIPGVVEISFDVVQRS